jgi:N-acetylneuraminic acid mutarotase
MAMTRPRPFSARAEGWRDTFAPGKAPRAVAVVAALVALLLAVGVGRAGAQARFRVLLPEIEQAVVRWRDVAPLARPRGFLAVAEIGGKVYAVGGRTYGSSRFVDEDLDALEEYDPATDTWRTRASMPTARVYLGAAAVGGRLYAIGGRRLAEALALVEEYDPVADAWRARAPMPTARMGAAAAALNGRVYVAGGDPTGSPADGPYLTTLEEYDPAADAWRSRAPMPTGRRSLALVAGANGRLYAIGGYDGAALATVEEYDPTTDTWRSRAPMPTRREYPAAVAAPNGRVYAIGGRGDLGVEFEDVATVEEYDPAADAWLARRSLRLARAGPGATTAGGRLYVVGGAIYIPAISNSQYRAEVEEGTLLP